MEQTPAPHWCGYPLCVCISSVRKSLNDLNEKGKKRGYLAYEVIVFPVQG